MTACFRCGAPIQRSDAAYCRICGNSLSDLVPVGSPLAVDVPASPTRAPAGWYSDPDGSLRQRWWDGSGWTWQVTSYYGIEWAPPPPERVVHDSLKGIWTAIIGFAIGGALAILIQLGLWGAGHPGGVAVLLGVSELGLWIGLVGAVWVVSRRRGTGSLRQDFAVRFRSIDLGFGLAGSIAGRFLASAAAAPFSVFLLHQHTSVDQQRFARVTDTAFGWLVLVLVTCVGAPVVEELFFRGLVQTRLVGRYGAVRGIGITSLLFGAAHLIGWAGPISILYAWSIAAAGVALGTIRHVTGRLGTSMAAHAMFNAQAMALLALAGFIR